MELGLTEIIVAIISSAGLGAIIAWFFGGRQSHKNTVDNDSHQREREFYDLVEKTSGEKVNEALSHVQKCAKSCKHSVGCPILMYWDDNKENS